MRYAEIQLDRGLSHPNLWGCFQEKWGIASLCEAFPQRGGLQRGKSPSAVRQISICYSNPVVCFDHFPNVRRMVFYNVSSNDRCYGIASFHLAFPRVGVLQRRKSLMLCIRFFYSRLRAKSSFALAGNKKTGRVPGFFFFGGEGATRMFVFKTSHKVS